MKMASNCDSSMGERSVAADFSALLEFHAEALHHFHFAQGIFGARFVGGDAVGVQAAGKFIFVEDGDGVAPLG